MNIATLQTHHVAYTATGDYVPPESPPMDDNLREVLSATGWILGIVFAVQKVYDYLTGRPARQLSSLSDYADTLLKDNMQLAAENKILRSTGATMLDELSQAKTQLLRVELRMEALTDSNVKLTAEVVDLKIKVTGGT